MMISIWQIAPSLRMGNTVVIKPSEHTPLSVLALVYVLNSVLPEGVLQVVPGGPQLGAAISRHEGSTRSCSPAPPRRAARSWRPPRPH
ncbi:Putative aldehyde dehydrogenase AldA [Rothia kristinae]|nr:Putative aldehyde dehydrogenase AldA [Rothia kristinae]